MGVTLQQWRIRIGSFVQLGPKLRFVPSMLVIRGRTLTLTLRCTLVMAILLLLCGDVEVNPGPVLTRLMSAQKCDYKDPSDIKDLKSSVDYFNKQFKTMESRIETLETVINLLYKENEQLKTTCQNLESQSRRDNLIFYGIKEETGNETWTDCENKVRNLLKVKVGIPNADKDSDVSIERAHRLGKKVKNPTKSRPIIVKFSRWKTKDDVLYKTIKYLKSQKDAGEPPAYGVSEDYSMSVRDARKKLLAFMQEKRTEFPEKKVFMKYDTVVVDKKHFKWDSATEKIIEIGKE